MLFANFAFMQVTRLIMMGLCYPILRWAGYGFNWKKVILYLFFKIKLS